METIKNTVFQVDSKIVKQELNSLNYLIEYSDNSLCDEEYCIVYFSSHNIYFPNTEKEFYKSIKQKNKFEWYGSRINKGYKHIFIRDIQKQWYLYGINNEINSVEKLENFLKIETIGYKVILVGSSAGGFIASLLGSCLNAEYVLTFNGQFQVLDLLESSNEEIDPILFRERNNRDINKYFSIRNYIKSPEKIFYFFSSKSSWDISNKKHIEDLGINIIGYNTSNHGIPFIKSAMQYVLNSPTTEIRNWCSKDHNPLFFSFEYGGVLNTLKVIFNTLKLKFLSV